MDVSDLGAILVSIIILLVLGALFVGPLFYDIGGNTVIQTDALDAACKEIYGQEYYWIEGRTGTELDLVCVKDEMLVVPLDAGKVRLYTEVD